MQTIMLDIDKWLREQILFLIESPTFKDGFTLKFLVDYIDFTCLERTWTALGESAKTRIIKGKLMGLERSGLVNHIGGGTLKRESVNDWWVQL